MSTHFTELNAFLISIATDTQKFPLFFSVTILSSSCLNWFRARPPRALTCASSLCARRYSNIFLKSLSRHRGRYDEGTPAGLSPFRRSTTRDFFHCSGKVPLRRHTFYKLSNMPRSHLCTAHRILVEMHIRSWSFVSSFESRDCTVDFPQCERLPFRPLFS